MLNIQTNRVLTEDYHSHLYTLLLLNENTSFLVDFTNYNTQSYTLLFLSPYQRLSVQNPLKAEKLLQFHGDFYCIEYHKEAVACNGLLFNTIYETPYIEVAKSKYQDIISILNHMEAEQQNLSDYSDAILKTYLQLILALSSKEKALQIDERLLRKKIDNTVFDFQELIEQNFIQEKSPSFYADTLLVPLNTLSRKTKQQLGKTPSQLIQERMILEAKRQLHLTHSSVKEIAHALNFDDEHYFSRYFKKHTGVSPSKYRTEVGVSIVAK